MGQLKTTGTFLFDIVEACVCETSSKLPQWVASLVAVQAYNEDEGVWFDYSGYEDNEITAYLVLFGKKGDALFHAENLMKAVGWDGVDFAALDQMDYSSIQIQGKMEESEYDGKTTIKLTRIDHRDADPSRALRRLDVDDLKKLNARFATGLRKLGGGPKPKSAPTVVPPTIAKSEEKEAAAETTAADTKEAAKKAYEDKKARAKAAEEKAAKTAAKKGDKPAMPPKPPAKPPVPKPAGDLSDTCSQEDAWETAYKAKRADVTDDMISNLWLQVIGDFGGEEKIGENWAGVRDALIQVVS